MRSLTAHLQEPDGHDGLPFHPSCPICRQTRLSGSITSGGLVSQRTQALLAASLLAASATVPATAAFAVETDQQQDGTAAVEQSGPSDIAGNPNFDPGGDATDLPDAAPRVAQAQAPADPATEDTAPVEQPTTTNPDDPVVDAGDGSDPAPPPTPVNSPAPRELAPAAPAATPSTPTETTSGAVPSQPTTAPAPAPTASASREPPAAQPSTEGAQTHRRTHKPARKPSNAASQSTPAAAADAPTTPAASPASTVSATATVAGGRPARPGDRAHTVVAGESLWAIATDVLGADATPAQVAREVNRVWQLNRDRIGTGDPDLLPIGTRLALR